MARILSAFAIGLLFGFGLLVSQMANPAKVLAFLDVFGAWDPSLAFVMGGAVIVSSLGYLAARRLGHAVLATKLDVPSRRDIDPRLVAGAALFGLGWGLVGICPLPALTLLSILPREASIFVASMLVGMALFRLVPHRGQSRVASMTREADA